MRNTKINFNNKGRSFKSLLLIGFCSFNLSAFSHTNMLYAQSQSFTIEMTNTTVKGVFDYIEANSEFVFLYDKNVINLNKQVNMNVKGRPIQDVLDEVLEGQDVVYEINDRQIALKKISTTHATQQTIRIKGVVNDATGPVIGANVVVKGTDNGVITDMDGKFTLEVHRGDILQISYIGYKTQEVEVKNQHEFSIMLKEDSEVLEDVVVVGYGTQKKESVVGSVQMVKSDQLKVPSSNLSAGFAGRLAGVISVQRSGQPGADGSNFWIRGISSFNGAVDPLIIIDGVQASSGDLNALDPEVIESFSVLKDATATALYGSRGANGVMIVNTKSGRESEKAIVNVRVESSYSSHTKTPDFVDGVRFMEMYNEAVKTRGTGEILYTQDKINGTRAGLNKYVYPNVNWYDEMFRQGAWNQNANINIRGGSKILDYFSSVSVNHDSGVLKNTKDFTYNNNLDIMRYVFQNNFNLNLSKSSKLTLNLNVQLNDEQGPNADVNNLFWQTMNQNPVDFPVRFPDDPTYDYIRWGGKAGGQYNNSYQNPYAEMAKGYNTAFSSTVMANLKFEQKLDFITEGLSASALFSFKNWSSTTTKRSANYNQFQVIDYDSDNLSDYTLGRIGTEQSTVLNTESENTGDRRIYWQAMINYDRTFGGLHNVSGMLLYNQDQYDTNNPSSLIASLHQRKQGLAGRVTYAYDYKYMGELNFGYNGSENFAEGHRFGFFPSVALGYTISREDFFEPLSDIITNLKLRASWGLVGNDQISGERYLYLSDINLQDGDLSYTTGRDQDVTKNGPKYLRYPNNDITWEVGSKWNLGMDLSLWNSFNFTLDVFKEIRSDIFMERQQISDYWGISGYDKWMNLKTKVYGNLGKVENKGLDFSVDYAKKINKDWDISFKGTFTYAHNTILEYDEPDFQKYPNLSRVGHSVDQQLLYIADDHLFIDDEEVRRSPEQKLGGWVQAGDIKYKDLPNVNGVCDGIIDSNDRQYTGNPTTPEIVYGFGPSIRWKNWDLSLFFQGAAKVSIIMRDMHPFGNTNTRNVLQYIADDYWSETNQNIHAAYPRLSKSDNDNNTQLSTYWQRNGAFIKLKNAEIGYTHKFFRVYLRGSNLLTFSPFKYWDPEMGGGNGLSYPTQRVVNFGIQFSLNNN